MVRSAELNRALSRTDVPEPRCFGSAPIGGAIRQEDGERNGPKIRPGTEKVWTHKKRGQTK